MSETKRTFNCFLMWCKKCSVRLAEAIPGNAGNDCASIVQGCQKKSDHWKSGTHMVTHRNRGGGNNGCSIVLYSLVKTSALAWQYSTMQIEHLLFSPPSFLCSTTTVTFSHSFNDFSRQHWNRGKKCIYYRGSTCVMFLTELSSLSHFRPSTHFPSLSLEVSSIAKNQICTWNCSWFRNDKFRDIRLIFGPGYFEDAFFFFFSFKNKYKFIVKEKKYPIKKFIMSISFSELFQVLLDYEYIFKFNDKFVYIIL